MKRLRNRGMTRTATGCAVVFVAICASCGDAPSDQGPSVRDSAGIRIVENVNPQWEVGQSWSLADTPSMRIGGTGEPDSELWRVTGGLRLSDGRVLIANNGTKQLRFYDHEGSLLHTTGREGEGPGEFVFLFRIWQLPGDSVIAYDPNLRRISLYDGSGSLVGIFRAPYAFVSYHHAFSDGTMLGTLDLIIGPGPASGVRRDSMAYALYGRNGELRDTIGWFRADEYYLYSTVHEYGALEPPFRRQAAHAVHGSDLYTGYGDRYEIRRWSPPGRLQSILRRTVSPVEIRDGIDLWAEVDSLEIPTWLRNEAAGFDLPTTMPAFSAFMVDERGNLWVRRPAWPNPVPDSWDVFNPDGWFLGTIDMPERFEPQQIGETWVIGTWKDELDVEQVRLYKLIKPRGHDARNARADR